MIASVTVRIFACSFSFAVGILFSNNVKKLRRGVHRHWKSVRINKKEARVLIAKEEGTPCAIEIRRLLLTLLRLRVLATQLRRSCTAWNTSQALSMTFPFGNTCFEGKFFFFQPASRVTFEKKAPSFDGFYGKYLRLTGCKTGNRPVRIQFISLREMENTKSNGSLKCFSTYIPWYFGNCKIPDEKTDKKYRLFFHYRPSCFARQDENLCRRSCDRSDRLATSVQSF